MELRNSQLLPTSSDYAPLPRLEPAPPDHDPIEVLTDDVGNGDIAIHLHDDAATPRRTTLAPLPHLSEQPFQAGADVYLSADARGTGTITVTNVPRGDRSRTQTLNVANWPSDRHAVTVVFTDYPVD